MSKRRAHGEGRIGGPCHAVTSRGTFCVRKARFIIGKWGYCTVHYRQEIDAMHARAERTVVGDV